MPRPKHKATPAELEKLFNQAVEAIPYELTPTSITQGDFEADKDGYIEYAEEFTFPVGQLFNEELTAGGWVELRHDRGDLSITGFFGVARDGDWKDKPILPECTAVQANYDLESRKWEFWIDQY